MSSIKNAWTYEQAREMLDLWKDCLKQIATGQAKSYKIGTREFTSLDLDEIQQQITYWANALEALSGKVNTKSVRVVIPRDL